LRLFEIDPVLGEIGRTFVRIVFKRKNIYRVKKVWKLPQEFTFSGSSCPSPKAIRTPLRRRDGFTQRREDTKASALFGIFAPLG
jgi:hypothetical protein